MAHATATNIRIEESSRLVDSFLVEDLWLEAFAEIGSGTLLIIGDSMRPFILRGDRVAVSAVRDPSSIRAGDVVLLRIENSLVVHRILAHIEGAGGLRFRQKGDATVLSSVVDAAAVLGEVTEIEREGQGRFCARDLRGGLFLLTAVRLTDLLYRLGVSIKEGLQVFLGPQRVSPFSTSLKKTMQRIQQSCVGVVSSKARPR